MENKKSTLRKEKKNAQRDRKCNNKLIPVHSLCVGVRRVMESERWRVKDGEKEREKKREKVREREMEREK